MNEQELIEVGRKVMHKTYCNGVTINADKLVRTSDSLNIYLDYLIPKKVREGSIEHLFFIRLKNVALITLSRDGKLLSNSSPREFIKETIERYKELLQNRERFIIKIFTKILIEVPQIQLSLTPLKKVLRKFKGNDYRTDNLERSFDEKEIKYIKFLTNFGYLRREEDKLTLDNEYIKKLVEQELEGKPTEVQINAIVASVFSNNFQYLITELQNSAIVPYIGIITTFCNLILEIGSRIKLPFLELFKLYRGHYVSGQNESDFEDKICVMAKVGLLEYNESSKAVRLPAQLFDELIGKFKLEFKQQQLT